jgi:Zn-finger protein
MIKKDCPYYPCHEKLEDCTFCYCPIYPCKNEMLGKWLISKKKKIWDCSDCTIVHKRKKE